MVQFVDRLLLLLPHRDQHQRVHPNCQPDLQFQFRHHRRLLLRHFPGPINRPPPTSTAESQIRNDKTRMDARLLLHSNYLPDPNQLQDSHQIFLVHQLSQKNVTGHDDHRSLS